MKPKNITWEEYAKPAIQEIKELREQDERREIEAEIVSQVKNDCREMHKSDSLRIADLEEKLGRSTLLRARDYLEAQRMSLYRSYSTDENLFLYEGVEFITEHLLAHFRR